MSAPISHGISISTAQGQSCGIDMPFAFVIMGALYLTPFYLPVLWVLNLIPKAAAITMAVLYGVMRIAAVSFRSVPFLLTLLFSFSFQLYCRFGLSAGEFLMFSFYSLNRVSIYISLIDFCCCVALQVSQRWRNCFVCICMFRIHSPNRIIRSRLGSWSSCKSSCRVLSRHVGNYILLLFG